MQVLNTNKQNKKIVIIICLTFAVICAALTITSRQSMYFPSITAFASIIACCICLLLPRSWKGQMISLQELQSILLLQISVFLVWFGAFASCQKLAPGKIPLVSIHNLVPWAITAFVAWKIKFRLQKNDHITSESLLLKHEGPIKTVFVDSITNIGSMFFLVIIFTTALMSGFYLITNLLGSNTAQLNSMASLSLSVLFLVISMRQKVTWIIKKQLRKKRSILFIMANKLIISLIIFLIANKLIHLIPVLSIQQPASLLNLRNNSWDMQLLLNAIFYCGSMLVAFMCYYKKNTKPALTVLSFAIVPASMYLARDLIAKINLSPNFSFICGIAGAIIILYQLSQRNNFSLLTKLAITYNGAKFRYPAANLITLCKVGFLAVAVFVFSSQHLLGIFGSAICLALTGLYWLIFIPRR